MTKNVALLVEQLVVICTGLKRHGSGRNKELHQTDQQRLQ